MFIEEIEKIRKELDTEKTERKTFFDEKTIDGIEKINNILKWITKNRNKIVSVLRILHRDDSKIITTNFEKRKSLQLLPKRFLILKRLMKKIK